VHAGVGAWLRDVESAVAGADAGPVLGAVLVLGTVALVSAWLAWRTLHRLRIITDTPTSKVRSAHQGYVELEGVARPMGDAPLTAPLTHLPCCWYRYRVEELQTVYGARGETRRRWKTIDYGASTDTFWLDDGTGRVAIDPEGADLRVRHKDVWRGASRLTAINAPSSILRPLASSNLSYRFTEERINPGDPLYALGLLKNLGVDVNAPTPEDRMREILRAWKTDQVTLHQRFDLNEDGRIDEREWLLARQAARREAEKAQREETHGTVEGINLLSRPVASGLPYLISAYGQHALARRKRVRVALYTAGFFLAGMLAVWLYNARFV
jgi:hypothetical protein